MGVKRVTRQLEELAVGVGELAVGRAREHPLVGSVELVAHDGATERGQVDADLVLASRVELAAHERVAGAHRR